MSSVKTAPYGSWKSPITPSLIVKDAVKFADIAVDGSDIYWSEVRPSEEGRYVIVKYKSGEMQDMTSTSFNVRTRVHEYGGGAFTVRDGIVFFSNFADQRLYRLDPGRDPVPLTPEQDCRYADGVSDPFRNRLIFVREDHTQPGEPVNTIVSLDPGSGSAGDIMVQGNNFYSSPCLSPDGSCMAWLAWDHPRMPWDGTELWLADITEQGDISDALCIAGGPDESVFQPRFSPDGTLYFISDPEGWWNIHRYTSGSTECVYREDAEFGFPQWVFGMSAYDFMSGDSIACAYARDGMWSLGILSIEGGICDQQDTGFSAISSVHTAGKKVLFEGGSPLQMDCLVLFDPETGTSEILRRSSDVEIPKKYISVPEPVTFPTGNGAEAHGFYYPPRNDDFQPPENELPPCMVMIHGGPTSASSGTFSLSTQYWTSRGFAVLDVNYRGSTGFGRNYRDLLKGNWGIADVEDCVNGAGYLVSQGLADRERLAIRGGSAGGYTTLCALTFHDLFTAGASYYGVSDTEILAQETHKFESRYLDQLIGPYPEAKDIYQNRSPLHFAEQLSCPVIFFQGLEDEIVPVNQAEMMVKVLKENGIPVAYLTFEGEQHGFRKAENIMRTLEAELYFYSRIFGFTLADDIEEVEIINLE